MESRLRLLFKCGAALTSPASTLSLYIASLALDKRRSFIRMNAVVGNGCPDSRMRVVVISLPHDPSFALDRHGPGACNTEPTRSQRIDSLLGDFLVQPDSGNSLRRRGHVASRVGCYGACKGP